VTTSQLLAGWKASSGLRPSPVIMLLSLWSLWVERNGIAQWVEHYGIVGQLGG